VRGGLFSTPNGCSSTNGFSADRVSGDRHAEKWNFDCVVSLVFVRNRRRMVSVKAKRACDEQWMFWPVARKDRILCVVLKEKYDA
jgi:hypothetical protein